MLLPGTGSPINPAPGERGVRFRECNMKFLFRWLIIMLIYAGVMYVVCPLLLPITNSFHLELTEWSSELMKNHPKSIAFFNFVSLFVLIVW